MRYLATILTLASLSCPLWADESEARARAALALALAMQRPASPCVPGCACRPDIYTNCKCDSNIYGNCKCPACKCTVPTWTWTPRDGTEGRFLDLTHGKDWWGTLDRHDGQFWTPLPESGGRYLRGRVPVAAPEPPAPRGVSYHWDGHRLLLFDGEEIGQWKEGRFFYWQRYTTQGGSESKYLSPGTLPAGVNPPTYQRYEPQQTFAPPQFFAPQAMGRSC